MIIIGAGISGLLAATQFQTAKVFESRARGEPGHKALLRFRSSAVGDAVGIEFRKVRVHKGIWRDGRHIAPSIKVANQYSQKVLGRLGDRSIWSVEPSDRYVAPDDFIDQLIERVGPRIEWDAPVQVADWQRTSSVSAMPIISTIPMSEVVRQLDLKKHPDFSYKGIHVSRFKIDDADVFQTIYFPSPDTDVYRASMTGDTLIIESMGDSLTHKEYSDVLDAFGIDQVSAPLENASQRFGKIAPIDDAWRRKFIVELTQRLNVYSLGRFAIWRNVLADDVLNDIGVIKKLLKGDAYASSLKGA